MPLDLLDTGKHWEAPPVDNPDNQDDAPSKKESSDLTDTDELDNLNKETGYGTDSLINAMNALPSKSSDNLFDVIMVNVSTLIRNNTILDRSNKEIQTLVEDDIHKLMNGMGAYQEQMSSMLTDPMIIFYLPDYSWLPLLHLRKPSPTKVKINAIIDNLIKMDNLKSRKQIRDQFMSSTVFELYTGGKQMLPHQSLTKFFNDLTKLGGIDPRQHLKHYLIISHCPLDYHFLLKHPRTTILESFTGKFIKAKQLGVKVFGTNFVPFNSVTHLLFGDPVQLKPMAQRKNRKMLMELAMRNSWHVRTPAEMAKQVGDTGQVEARVLEYLKL